MKYTVCIQAAGVGSRLTLANGLHKALIPINQKSVLSRIIKLFPSDTEFHVLVGYKKDQIKSYLEIVYPTYDIRYIEVENFSGPNTGPGLSLLKAREHLQRPFIFMACDTIVFNRPPLPEYNWIGISDASDSKDYLVAEVDENDNVSGYFDKQESKFVRENSSYYKNKKKLFDAFIGLAGIFDYSTFWKALEKNNTVSQGEVQVTSGLKALIGGRHQTRSKKFKWIDTGTNKSYSAARAYFKDKFLLKPDEFLFKERKKIIKFFLDSTKAKKRFERAKFLEGISPKTYFKGENFIWYSYVEGKLISENKELEIFENFLHFMHRKLWTKTLNDFGRVEEMKTKASHFYKEKTYERVEKFIMQNERLDQIKWINNSLVRPVKDLLLDVSWDYLANGIFTKFHGDPQPENVIVINRNKFSLIDWREDFGGDIEYGDTYYDLAKIYHALIITHKKIREKKFFVNYTNDIAFYKFSKRRNLIHCLARFEKFIKDKGYSLYKVKLISALIYLNIAPLHHHPYSELLFFHGKIELTKLLSKA